MTDLFEMETHFFLWCGPAASLSAAYIQPNEYIAIVWFGVFLFVLGGLGLVRLRQVAR